MKSRKRVIVAFLLVCCMILGVGYAALSDTLTIIGNTVIDMDQAEENYEEKVYFSNAVFTHHGSGDDTKDTVGGINTDDATFSIHSLATKDEYATIVFTIKNESNVPVLITIPDEKLSGGANQSNSNTEYFNIAYVYSRNDMTIPSGETMDVTVTVTVKKPVTAATGATFGIEYTATTVG